MSSEFGSSENVTKASKEEKSALKELDN